MRYDEPTVNIGLHLGLGRGIWIGLYSFRWMLSRGERIKMTRLAGILAFLYDTSRRVDTKSRRLRRPLRKRFAQGKEGSSSEWNGKKTSTFNWSILK